MVPSNYRKYGNSMDSSFSVNMKIACPMQLNLYPMDTQTCRIRFSASRYRYAPYVNATIFI